MQSGTILRQGKSEVIGRWQADGDAISVETGDPDLREAAAAILATPQPIPVHGAEHFEFAAAAEDMVATPSRIGLLALFALEMEARGYEVMPDEEG